MFDPRRFIHFMYDQPFFITEPVSNNEFSFQERTNRRLYVPKLVQGTLNDVVPGNEVVFEDFDDDGVLRSCKGLREFVEMKLPDRKADAPIPAYVFDNHNHAFAFWVKEWLAGNLHGGALLVHVDQHKDTRIPPEYLSKEDARDVTKVFEYTNRVLHVGDFIPAAQHIGLVKEIIFIDSERSIDEFDPAILAGRDVILDIDLDFFQPELDYIGNERKLDLIARVMPKARVVTFATSPFFIDQFLALEWLRKICALF